MEAPSAHELLTDPNLKSSEQMVDITKESVQPERQISPFAQAIRSKRIPLILQFGGQGLSYWPELQLLYKDSKAAKQFIIHAAAALLQESSSENVKASPALQSAIDLELWLSTPEKASKFSSTEWSNAVYSYPLIFITQMSNYFAFLERAELTHQAVLAQTECAIGHSQGVVSALVCALAADEVELLTIATEYVKYMFWHGLRTHEAWASIIPEIASKDATPMLAVSGLTEEEVERILSVFNARAPHGKTQISLINGKNMFSITGHPEALKQLEKTFQGKPVPADKNQNRIPYSDRPKAVSTSFVPLSCPFHSPILGAAQSQILADVQRFGLSCESKHIRVPVYKTTKDASNLQQVVEVSDLLPIVVDMQLNLAADWMATWHQVWKNHGQANYVLDFGPGQGASRLSAPIAEPAGFTVVSASFQSSVTSTSLQFTPCLGLEQLLNAEVTLNNSWMEKYAPKLHHECGNQIVSNKFTRLLKKPPVMVAGMTPTTSLNGIDLVAAAQNAGFHAELAGGGLSRLCIFENSISKLVSKLTPGYGITINMLYLNAKQWGFQFPAVLRLRRQGVPIESITIGAGIPSLDRADEIIQKLQSVRINLIAFKPGSTDGIYSVLDIAQANPKMNIMLQWTGGRAGGHHSFEDFHEPLENTYAAIRRLPNVILVVGSGFGDWKDSVPYLTGDWSLKRGNIAAMPVDGILLGSRMMVAKEAATAKEVKQLLVDTPGISNESEWEKSYKGIVGGVITVTSELGEPIHKIAGRGTMCWRDFDEMYFSKPREELEGLLRQDKAAIIERLNKDFQKPYFGCKKVSQNDSTEMIRVPADLHEMTYEQVMDRMIELMFVEKGERPNRWIHGTYQSRLTDFIKRSAQVFSNNASSGFQFDSAKVKTHPREVLREFIACYPQASTTPMSVSDIDYFLHICQSGGKPVNFIPIIDADFRTWFKKDSLWYSEDLDAVPDRDAQRVCILQGPVAVRYSTICDEPVAKILGDIAAGYVRTVEERTSMDTGDCAISSPESIKTICGIPVGRSAPKVCEIILDEDVSPPDFDLWLDGLLSLLGPDSVLSVLLSAHDIVRGSKWISNPIRPLLRPLPARKFVIHENGFEIYKEAESSPTITISKTEKEFHVHLSEIRPCTADLPSRVVPLHFCFRYKPDYPLAIHEDEDARMCAIKNFYAMFWVAEKDNEEATCSAACQESVFSTFECERTVTDRDIADYKAAMGFAYAQEAVPADFATILAWKPLIQSVFTRQVNVNLLDLVHLSHSYKLLKSGSQQNASYLFKAGDETMSACKVASVRITEYGKAVSGIATISQRVITENMVEELVPVVELRSEFLIRGEFDDFENTFTIRETNDAVQIVRDEDFEVLMAKSWFVASSDSMEQLSISTGDEIRFELTTRETFSASNTIDKLEISGKVYLWKKGKSVELIGTIQLSTNELQSDPIRAYIDSLSQPDSQPNADSLFPNGGYNMLEVPVSIYVPKNAVDYAVASRDLNPIHRSEYAAILANLPSGRPIMHGMWSATKVRSLLIDQFGQGNDTNVVSYAANFDGMVYPGDNLYLQARHVGQRNGNKLLEIQVVNASKERVITAKAEIKQPLTAFVFTGQGSAEVGMGMDRYEVSAISRETWNRGEKHLQRMFGFSILDIVRKNPSKITIHFGGRNGRRIRDNYMKLKCDKPETGESVPLIPEINERTQSFTFSAPEGLLFATQFSQPALVLLEKAMFCEIKKAQLIGDDSAFAGHSLGEYAGLCSFAEALEVEDVVEIVFLRGLIMQRAVKRDEMGRSEYGMVAANPSRIGGGFTAADLFQVVDKIYRATDKLLQVVNYNVKNLQYVVAGHSVNLEVLATVLTKFAKSGGASIDLDAEINQAKSHAQARREKCKAANRPFTLSRGHATIPLVGIDVPFHSRELLSGVPSFRKLLRVKIDAEILSQQAPKLIDRYIPNLVAKPLSLDRSYVQHIYDVTNSPFLAEVLEPVRWESVSRPELMHLLLTELLAYQFASPVQWITTQDYLFSKNGNGVHRLIEIGPSPTLTNMALRTLQSGDFSRTQREILYYQRDRDVVHFEQQNEFPSAAEYADSLIQVDAESVDAAEEDDISTELSSVPQAPVVMPPVMAAPAAGAIEDRPLSPDVVLCSIVALRTDKMMQEIKPDQSVKSYCAGKSALQNEIMGDLEKEFTGAGTIPDGAAELPIKDLTSNLVNYKKMGSVSSSLIAQMLTNKMPGGFTVSKVRSYLTESRGLGSGLVDSVLVFATTEAPKTRLKNEDAAQKWLDSCVDHYAGYAGISLARPSASMGTIPNSMYFMPQAPSIPNVSDQPVDAKHVIRVLVAVKVGKPYSEVLESSTINSLCGGKSALQNEVVGDLANEFGSASDDAAELKISELAGKVVNYSSPGKVSSAMIAKMYASRLPGGFGITAVRQHLSGERCLPPGRIQSILIHSLLYRPKQRLNSDAQAKKWLDDTTDDYAKWENLDIPYRSKFQASMPNGMMSSMGASSGPTEFEKKLKAMIEEQSAVATEFLGKDHLDWHRKVEMEAKLREEVEASMSVWTSEHGEAYGAGIQAKFDAKKERVYDSFWSWALQDAFELYYRTLDEATTTSILPIANSSSLQNHFMMMSKWINTRAEKMMEETSKPPLEWFKPLLCNRVTPELLRCTRYFEQRAESENRYEYSQAIQLLAEQLQEWMKRDPVNVHIFESSAPHLKIQEDGKIVYDEIPRSGVSDSTEYVREMARGLEYNVEIENLSLETAVRNAILESAIGFEAVNEDDDLISYGDGQHSDDAELSSGRSEEVMSSPERVPSVIDKGEKLTALRESLRNRAALARKQRSQTLVEQSSILRFGLDENLKQIVLPHVHLRKPSSVDPMIRLYDVALTCTLLRCMHEMATEGASFVGKVALVTGCGRNSIGAQIVKSLLEGGATVFVTTSSYSLRTTKMFQSIYEEHGSRGSRLIVVPFNQASKVDTQSLIKHIYDTHKLDLDVIIPFAALPETGRMLTDLDGRSELAHRIMLTNTLRLIGEVASAKQARNITSRPALALIPLSPNHGNFGGDGLYAESKLGIESLLNKWQSEPWSDQISVVGAVIGWTRGTGLMSGNNVVAEGVEKLGVRTFSTVEMGFNLSALLHPLIAEAASESPLWVDLTGGMAQIQNLKDVVDDIRSSIMKQSKLNAAIFSAARNESGQVSPIKTLVQAEDLDPKANLSRYYCETFPSLDEKQVVKAGSNEALLGGMIDLEKVIVVTGFGEVGPWGNSRTRWEMESFGEFSLEGCIELAWLTGYIVYKNGSWADATTNEIIPDHLIKSKYEETMLEHAGIRVVEPELFEGYDPKKKSILHQVAIDKKMSPIEVASFEEAILFRDEIGEENLDIYQDDCGSWMIRLRKGCVLSIPRALKFDRFVAGQIPTGWNIERLGMPKDLANSVDPITLYTLASTADTFISAGIVDPYEFYQYIHVSEIGNMSGGGMGGMRALRRIFQLRLLGRGAPSDTLQECFINTPPAWVNMLLLSSSGPIKTPVGACATAAESVDAGVDTIKRGKARVVIVGGYDDFGEEGAFEFAQMKATSDSVNEMAMGRDAREMCRPCSSTRGGFMESYGAGTQLLMDAKLALEMGCPIYGIVALTNTATDKNGRSVPAPGQGILTTAREVHCAGDPDRVSPLLDATFRRRQFGAELLSIDKWFAHELECADENQVEFLHQMKERKVKAAQELWGMEFYQSRNDIAPLRGALSVWNLTVDDIGAVSFHGTGTQANDKNESDVTQKQMRHLGRSIGNPLPVICQKYLTGHPKGAAAAWMLNGLLQVLNSGIIPGNRSLDNTCTSLRKFDYLLYPNRSIQTNGIKAGLMKSFGFGQAGGEILLLHPDILLSILPRSQVNRYMETRTHRMTQMNSHLQRAVTGKGSYMNIKDAAPYTPDQESQVYLDPTARACYDTKINSWRFQGFESAENVDTQDASQPKPHRRVFGKAKVAESKVLTTTTDASTSAGKIAVALNQAASSIGLDSGSSGLGVDVEPIATFECLDNRENFLSRNFTEQEIAYCKSAPHPAASFAGRWAAKEAVIKAISNAAPSQPNLWKGSGASLREIETFLTASGAPAVLLTGFPLEVYQRVGLESLKISISHSGDYAVAQAVVSHSRN
uniref:Fatty acid synthase subunit alpha n=1 Tax=Albugo laibachii Nc14 TaxID=890382 RepID=F0WVF1_9STRA|nr:FAS2_PENPA Fatty acid synthase subunit alpha putati [Albugo laibachii Nc14]CCA25465.1 fatty acid synthase alphasubunit putative [Albugo laibachii Nc14]|eukprot:CCA25465.1 fatty acid synthase alphasubunit putative [Albugo laibachii Nc14]